MATTGARDTSTYDICEPWYGDKGGPFTRTFSPAFLSGMRGKSEEYVTYYDHLQGDSPGGYKAVPVGSPPGTMPVFLAHRGGVGSDIRFKSERSFASRDQKIIDAIRRHVPVTSLQTKIDTLQAKQAALDYAGGAKVLEPIMAGAPQVPHYPVGHPQHTPRATRKHRTCDVARGISQTEWQ